MAPGEKPAAAARDARAGSPTGARCSSPPRGDIFTVDVRDGAVRALVQPPETEEYAEASPDGARVAFVRKNDLYVVDVASGRETPPHAERLRHAAERQARLGLRGGAGVALRPGLRLVARLAARSRTCSSTSRGCRPSRSWTSCRCATRSSGSATPRPAPRTRSCAWASWASTRTAPPAPSGSSPFDPDDVYVLPQLGWTPDSRGVAFQHLNRAQDELELRLLPVPSSPREALGTPRTILTETLEDLGQHLRRPALPEGRAALPLAVRARRLRAPLPLRPRRRLPRRDAGPLDRRTGGSRSPAPAPASCSTSAAASSTSPRPRRTRASATSTGSASTAPGARGSPARTARTAASSRPTAASTRTPGRTCRPPRASWVTSQDGTRRFDARGQRARRRSSASSAARLEWVELKAKDGTAALRLAAQARRLRPARRYPVIVSVYGGPHAQTVTNSWGHVSPFEHLLGEPRLPGLFKLDNRGMAARGTAFEFAGPPGHGQGRARGPARGRRAT